MSDVIAHPSTVGLAHRWAQLESDRLRLLAKMERELYTELTPPLASAQAPIDRRPSAVVLDRVWRQQH